MHVGVKGRRFGLFGLKELCCCWARICVCGAICATRPSAFGINDSSKNAVHLHFQTAFNTVDTANNVGEFAGLVAGQVTAAFVPTGLEGLLDFFALTVLVLCLQGKHVGLETAELCVHVCDEGIKFCLMGLLALSSFDVDLVDFRFPMPLEVQPSAFLGIDCFPLVSSSRISWDDLGHSAMRWRFEIDFQIDQISRVKFP